MAAPNTSHRFARALSSLRAGDRLLFVARPVIAVAQHGFRSRQIAAGIEHRGRRQPEPGQIGAVDLPEAHVDGLPLRDQAAGDLRGLIGGARRIGRTILAVHADGERVEATLGGDELFHDGGGDTGRAVLSDGPERSGIHGLSLREAR